MEDIIRLAYKAGKLSVGRMQVIKSIKKSKLIIMAHDFSSKYEIIKIAQKIGKKVIIVNRSKRELGEILNREEVGVISINDNNFYKLFLKRGLNDDMVSCRTGSELSWYNK